MEVTGDLFMAVWGDSPEKASGISSPVISSMAESPTSSQSPACAGPVELTGTSCQSSLFSSILNFLSSIGIDETSLVQFRTEQLLYEGLRGRSVGDSELLH